MQSGTQYMLTSFFQKNYMWASLLDTFPGHDMKAFNPVHMGSIRKKNITIFGVVAKINK